MLNLRAESIEQVTVTTLTSLEWTRSGGTEDVY